MPTTALPFSDIGGGVAPGPVPFNRKTWDNPIRYKLNRAYGDEFEYPNFQQLSRRWSMHTAVSADFMFPGGSAIQWNPSAAGSALYIPIPAGDFEAVLEYQRHRTAARQDDMFGLALLDASGAGVGYTTDYDGNSYTWDVVAWAYSGTGSGHAAVAAAALPSGGTHIWTCIRGTGTLVQGRESGDGSTLNTLNAGTTIGVTPLYLAIVRMFANASEWITLNRLNVYSTPTFFPG
jgi:hypothetical protein